MNIINIFDPAMCCNSGICGVDVDQTLVTFSADIEWLKEQGKPVERFNLAQQPMAFAENSMAKRFLERSGEEGLPLVLVDGEIVLTGRYPRRAELARWAGISIVPVAAVPTSNSGCCSGNSTCS